MRRCAGAVVGAACLLASLLPVVAALAPHHARPTSSQAWQETLRLFPQAQRCTATPWLAQYAALHSDVLAGRRPPKYLVAVLPATGTADRWLGLITLFWIAVLQGRAFTAVNRGPIAPFSAACDFPSIAWEHPDDVRLPEGAVQTLLRPRTLGSSAKAWPGVSLMYHTFSTLYEMRDPSMARELAWYEAWNWTQQDPPTPLFMAASNRGRTYTLAQRNAFHRDTFRAGFGLAPEDVFACGFFALCSPNAAVQAAQAPFWAVLQESGVLSIGIQIRVGDHKMRGRAAKTLTHQRWTSRESYFKCAQALEAAFAKPGQKVIWFLNSDDKGLRDEAKARFGDKLLTSSQEAAHVNCLSANDTSLCSPGAAQAAMQDAMGAMLSFSMTQYQVISHFSGFGRMPAWLAARRDRIYELSLEEGQREWGCRPLSPTPPEASATGWSGV